MPKNATTSQAPSKGKSIRPASHAVGSGSRPGGGSVPIKSSNPPSPQKIRG